MMVLFLAPPCIVSYLSEYTMNKSDTGANRHLQSRIDIEVIKLTIILYIGSQYKFFLNVRLFLGPMIITLFLPWLEFDYIVINAHGQECNVWGTIKKLTR